MTEERKDFAKNKKLLRKNIERAKTEKAADASRRRRDVCKKCFYFQGQSQGPNGSCNYLGVEGHLRPVAARDCVASGIFKTRGGDEG